MKKSPHNIQTVGIVANPEKTASKALVRKAFALVKDSGHPIISDDSTLQMTRLDAPRKSSVLEVARHCDLLLVFGGDGTILRVAREVGGLTTPILGINVGALGFLTAVPSSGMEEALSQIWQGAFTIESRPLISISGHIPGKTATQEAFNDFVIGRGITSRMIKLEVSVDGVFLTRYLCDGLIISSPTGSTAYSLSAGGAIITPNANVLSITPICPHSLNNRSVIVNIESTIEVHVVSQKLETVLTSDGQVQFPLAAHDRLLIQKSSRHIRLLRLDNSSFFNTLRQKLNWRGSNF